jgi:hypothetical protein
MGRKKKIPPVDPVDQDLGSGDIFTEGLLLQEPSGLNIDAEAAWVRLQGATPLEFLVMVYKNPWTDMKDRVNAAKSILDFVHRKLPQKIEVDGNMVETRKLSAENLGKLSDAELELFTKLLGKMDK